MELSKVMEKRFSVRKFDERAVEEELIEKIIKAGLSAPTACNKQPQKIYAVSGASLEKIARSTECLYGAPLAFLICCDEKNCWKRSYDGKKSGDVDASIVTTYMMLEAEELGIGTTWVMYFDPVAVKSEFELKDGIEPVAILIAGYPKEGVKPSAMHFENRDYDEIVVREK